LLFHGEGGDRVPMTQRLMVTRMPPRMEGEMVMVSLV
jgi:hypothetical protein